MHTHLISSISSSGVQPDTPCYYTVYLFAHWIIFHADYFKINLFRKKSFRNTSDVKEFGSRSGPTFCRGPDLGPNCLQKLSADGTSRIRDFCVTVNMQLTCMLAPVYFWELNLSIISSLIYTFTVVSCRTKMDLSLIISDTMRPRFIIHNFKLFQQACHL